MLQELQKELSYLLRYNVEFMMYGTNDPEAFSRMKREYHDDVFCHGKLVMDDAILFGMYPAAVHVDPAIRARVINEQQKHIQRFTRESSWPL